MTKEKVIDILKGIKDGTVCLMPNMPEDGEKAIDIAIKAVEQSEQHWIPVTKRLPNIGESVLVTFDTEEVCEMKLWEIKGVAQYWCNPYDGYTYEFDRIIAWMPLPEHYKGVTTPPECEGDCGWCKPSVIKKCKRMTE